MVDILPLLYHLGDWKEAAAVMDPARNALSITVASLTVNLIHNVTDERCQLDTPIEALQARFPELAGAASKLRSLLGADGAALLAAKPGTFAMACLLEVLGRWQLRGVAVNTGRCPAAPLPEVAARLSARQVREYTESVQDMLQEYTPRLQQAVRATPAVAFVAPIYAALAAGSKPPLPPAECSLLRGPLHAHMRCALPGCASAYEAGGGGRLKICSGGCCGLARYCCAAHQAEHWEQHKRFCKRLVA